MLKIISYGPGWNKNKPQYRLGDPKDLPKVNYEIYNPKIDILFQIYTVIQLLIATAVMSHFLEIQSTYSDIDPTQKYQNSTCWPVILWLFWTSVRVIKLEQIRIDYFR